MLQTSSYALLIKLIRDLKIFNLQHVSMKIVSSKKNNITWQNNIPVGQNYKTLESLVLQLL